MLRGVVDYLVDLRDRQRIAIGLAKGAASRQARTVNLKDPSTWEFSGFSQNGEDGVIDVLRSHLRERNRCVVEIGAGEGTENNSSWLLLTEQYQGLLVEGDARQSARARRNVCRYSIGSECLPLFITLDTISEILCKMPTPDPDVFSLDIDGNDLHIASALFERGFRPRIVVVEYNSAFGPERSVTSRYSDTFRRVSAHPSLLYYGASVCAWKTLFLRHGYRFISVESRGVNAFFVNPEFFEPDFLEAINGIAYAENRYQLLASGKDHTGQFALIADQPLEQV